MGAILLVLGSLVADEVALELTGGVINVVVGEGVWVLMPVTVKKIEQNEKI